MIATLLVALSALLPAPILNDGELEDESTLVRYDLRPVTPRFDDGTEWQEPIFPVVAGSPEEHVSISELYSQAPPEVVLDVVTRILGDEMLRKGRVVMLDGNTSLLVLAPPSVQDQIQRILDTLTGALSASERLRMDVFTIPQAGGDELVADGVLSVAEADALAAELVGRGAAHRTSTLELLPGRTTVLDQTRMVPCLTDYDVEIAQASMAFDPVVAELREGLRVLVRGAVTGDGLTVSMVLSDSALIGDIGERPLGLRGGVGDAQEGGMLYIEGPTSIQVPDVRSHAVAFSTHVPADGVVAFASESKRGADGARHVVMLRRTGGISAAFTQATFGTVRLMMVNSEAFGLPRFRIEGASLGWDDFGAHPSPVATLVSEPSAFLFDWLKYRFSVWRRLGPWAIVVTDPAWDNQAGRELEQLLGSLDLAQETVRVTADLEDAQGTRLARWSLPLLAGTRCGAFVGHSTSALVDFDVEVAQFATVSDPVVAPLFEGLSLALDVSGGPGHVIDASGLAQRIERPILGRSEALNFNGPFTGGLDRPTIERLVFSERATVSSGETLTVGASSARPSEAPGLRLVVGVR